MLKSSISDVFAKRRAQLKERDTEGAVLLASHPEMVRNHDVHHAYRQDSSLYYLTGYEEAGAWALLLPNGELHLFVRERNPERELWDGERYGVEGAKKIFGATESYTVDQLPTQLPKLLEGAKRLYYSMGHFEAEDRQVLEMLKNYRSSKGRTGMGLLPIYDPVTTVGEMRLRKDSSELDIMRQACEISAQAHKKIMQSVRPGMLESEIEALLAFEFRHGGCERNGYESIVAGGANACTLHYVSNNEKLVDGGLLLIDAGGEHSHYTADITRTFPIGQKFSKEQANIYDLVLKAQKESIAEVKVGNTVLDYHNKAIEVLTEGLLSLGLLKGDAKKIIADGDFRRFYPHGTGHWLGMDVHDCGLYRDGEKGTPLEPGMVLTVEPGLYCQLNDKECPEAYRGIGVRIEDNIVVTEKGPENLTASAPKERAEIEALRGA